MTKRLAPEIRRDQILNAAITLAKANGFNVLSRDQVAIQAGCSNGQISRMFNTMNQLKRAVIRYCVSELKKNIKNEKLLLIVAQGLASGHAAAISAPADIKREAVKTLL